MINLKQKSAYNDATRFQYWLAGRRGGKTFGLSRKIRRLAYQMPKGSEMAYIGPTNQQSLELIWDTLIELFHEAGWSFRPMISKQMILLPGNRKIYVIGAEKISRIRGHAMFHVFLDEIAFFGQPLKKIWKALRPTLSDLGGGATLATTPYGKGTDAYDLWLEAKESSQWSTHFWYTMDNPHISRSEIDEARSSMDEKSFLQEYMASWVSFEGLAYYCFDENTNIAKQPALDSSMPIKLLFDFNVNPTTLLVSQYDRKQDINRILKEYSQPNSSTEATVQQFCDDHKHLIIRDKQNVIIDLPDIRIRGDASGKNRTSATGFSDYYYVAKVLYDNNFITDPNKPPLEVPSKNPAIVDRVKYANTWLKSYDGRHRVEIDPSCKDLIRDLSSQVLIGRKPSDKNNLGHKADAFGYDIYWEHVGQQKRTTRSIQL